MSKKDLRCAQVGMAGAPCGRAVSAEWTCVGCGAPACEEHSQSVVFGNFGDRSAACLCFDCLAGLPEDESVATRRERIWRIYEGMLRLAMQRGQEEFTRRAHEWLRAPNSSDR